MRVCGDSPFRMHRFQNAPFRECAVSGTDSASTPPARVPGGGAGGAGGPRPRTGMGKLRSHSFGSRARQRRFGRTPCADTGRRRRRWRPCTRPDSLRDSPGASAAPGPARFHWAGSYWAGSLTWSAPTLTGPVPAHSLGRLPLGRLPLGPLTGPAPTVTKRR